jgi:hypothetical protein
MKDHVNAEYVVDLAQPLPKIWHDLLKSGMPQDEAREFMKYVKRMRTT